VIISFISNGQIKTKMKKLNILELHRTINERQQRKNECFDKVLDLCHKKIVLQTEHSKLNCFYEVPLYIFGYPIYDISKCIEYLKMTLENEGFLVKYFFPKYLYISWDFDEISENKTNHMSLMSHDPLMTNKLKPLETRVNKKMLMNDSMKKYTKNNPDVNILSYKPSGKLQLNLL